MRHIRGLYFALRSGSEHRNLRHKPSQITLFEPLGQRAYLCYVEDVSKNRKVKPKVMVHHANVDNPTRCFVRLYKLYKNLCPKDQPDHAFYLTPLKNPKEGCWFSRTALGHNTLRDMVKNINFVLRPEYKATKPTTLSGPLQQLASTRLESTNSC